MSQFDYLLIGHLIGDYLFQTSWMAQHKASKWLPLFIHVIIYTTVVSFMGFMSGGLSYIAISIIFISHMILDRRTFVVYWVEKIQRAEGPSKGWLTIMTDQIFHIIILAIAIYFS